MNKMLDSVFDLLYASIIEKSPFRLSLEENQLSFSPVSEISLSEEIENASLLATWLRNKIRYIDLFHLPYEEFLSIQKSVDLCYEYGKKVYQRCPDSSFQKEEIMAKLISLKLGGQMHYQKLLEEDRGLFYQFLKKSYLHHKLFAMRLPLIFSEDIGPMLPFEIDEKVTQYIPWRFLNRREENPSSWYYNNQLLFTTEKNHKLSNAYSCHRFGIKAHHPFKETVWKPFDQRDPAEWNLEYRLEIKTIFSSDPDNDPPFMLGVHAYLNLKNPKGEVRSVGQDMLEEYRTSKHWEVLSHKLGSDKIEIPDAYEFYPYYCRHFRSFAIVITKEQHDLIVQTVEAERKNPKRWASVCKGNCVSFVLNILKKTLNIEIDASFHGLHVYFRQITPYRWYRRWYDKYYRWYQRLSLTKRRALMFFPAYYMCTVVFGTIAALLSFNSFGGKRDFTFFDVFFRPWQIACHHPLKLYMALKDAADEDGIIHPIEERK